MSRPTQLTQFKSTVKSTVKGIVLAAGIIAVLAGLFGGAGSRPVRADDFLPPPAGQDDKLYLPMLRNGDEPLDLAAEPTPTPTATPLGLTTEPTPTPTATPLDLIVEPSPTPTPMGLVSPPTATPMGLVLVPSPTPTATSTATPKGPVDFINPQPVPPPNAAVKPPGLAFARPEAAMELIPPRICTQCIV